jgi:hypothetical protein
MLVTVITNRVFFNKSQISNENGYFNYVIAIVVPFRFMND